MKTELEEASEKYSRNAWGVYYDDINTNFPVARTLGETSKEDFIIGAKWMQEKMYSEEDMRKMYDISCGEVGLDELHDQTENNERYVKFLKYIKQVNK